MAIDKDMNKLNLELAFGCINVSRHLQRNSLYNLSDAVTGRCTSSLVPKMALLSLWVNFSSWPSSTSDIFWMVIICVSRIYKILKKVAHSNIKLYQIAYKYSSIILSASMIQFKIVTSGIEGLELE